MGPLKSFTCQYGGFHSVSWHYSFAKENGHLYLTAVGYNGVDLNVHIRLSQEEINQLTTVIIEENLAALKGCNESDDDLLDGYGFHLSIEFQAYTITADTYGILPENHDQWHPALAAYGC